MASVTLAHYREKQFLGRQTLVERVVKLGSDPKSHLVVEEAARMQAVIEIDGPQGITLIDLGKDPATHVNGAPVTKRALGVGDAIEVGRSRIVVERVTATEVSNPFEFASRNPFAVPTFREPADGPAAFGYRLVQQGPDLDPDEVEERGVTSVEVVIYWGNDILHVAHLKPPRDFVVGEDTLGPRACDFFLPAEVIGGPRLSIVECLGDRVTLKVPPGARGSLTMPGKPRLLLEEIRREPLAEVGAPDSVELPAGASARIALGDFSIRVATVNAARRIPTGVGTTLDWAVPSFFGMSTLVHASVLAALAFFVPPLGITEDEAVNQDRSYLVRQYLDAAARRAEEARPSDQVATVRPDDHEGGTGTRAMGEEGRMGSSVSKNRHGRFAIQGPKENQDVRISRDERRSEAAQFGMIGLLAGGMPGSHDTPTAPWGRESALGNDEVNALGNMWGDDIGTAFGYGGLGLTGIGEGGGGRGEGIGLGDIGTIGHGAGTGSGQGFGAGHGRLGPGHHPKGPSLHPIGETVLTGRLPAEVIQRIVRQNYGRFRACYETGLSRNPNLEGRVAVRFVIGRDGAVASAQNGGSDLADSGVVECVVRAYYGLSFPAPEGGIVTVIYPIMFSPA
jgi:hypothetical protein